MSQSRYRYLKIPISFDTTWSSFCFTACVKLKALGWSVAHQVILCGLREIKKHLIAL